LGSIIDKNGPKTMQGRANKMMTGDGRLNYDNQSCQEKSIVYLVLVHQVKRGAGRKKIRKGFSVY